MYGRRTLKGKLCNTVFNNVCMNAWCSLWISRRVGGLNRKKKPFPGGRYGYFLELHILLQKLELWKFFFAHKTDFYTHDTFNIKHIKQSFLMIKTSSINSIVIWEVKIELVLLGYQWKDASVGNYIPR